MRIERGGWHMLHKSESVGGVVLFNVSQLLNRV